MVAQELKGKNAPKQKIYEEDCEFYRYQDRLKWSRFQTVSLIEGAVLFAILKIKLNPFVEILIMVCGFLIVLLGCILSWIDQYDANNHLKRIKKFEEESKVPFPESSKIITGKALMLMAITTLNLFNLIFFSFRLLVLCCNFCPFLESLRS